MPEEQLNSSEIERYARHILLPEIGGSGQQKLKNARIAMLGAGGLGAPVLTYLAAAGIGTIGIIDDDIVSLSNLQRQIIHDTNSIGLSKTQSAANAIAQINPHVKIEQHKTRLTTDNAQNIFREYDLIVDGSDNFETRYVLADTAEKLKIPMVMAAVGRFDGSITVFTPYNDDDNGNPLPSIRDLYPKAPPEGLLPNCAQSGIIGALTGVIGTLQAMEVIKLITGIGDPLISRLMLYDGLSAKFDEIHYAKRKTKA